MTERKEIVIDKKQTKSYILTILKCLLLSVIILTAISHFGKFGGSCEINGGYFNPYQTGENCDNVIAFDSPISGKNYTGFEEIRINGFFKENRYQTSKESKQLNYLTKLTNYYIPSIFFKYWMKLIGLTIILLLAFKLKSVLSKKYKLKIK
jgi:hypothetical protein